MELVTQDLANKLGTVERRSCARLAVSSLIFVRLGYENGGIAFNISEGGLALSAANGLPDRGIPELTIQLPDSGDWIRTAAQITWRSVSNKECGLQYVGIGEEARQRIREWIAAEASSARSTPEAETKSGFQNVELDTTVPGLGDTVVSVGKDDIGQEDGDASAAAPAAEIAGHGTLQEKWPESESADATVFTKEKDEDKIVAERSMLPAPAFCVNPYYAEAVTDRRIHPRIRIIPPGYVELGN